MNKRLYGMAPGGRMALDKAANRRHNIWQAQRQARSREKRDGKNPDNTPVAVDKPSQTV